ncbi:MAG: gamma-glutamyltransferase family protein, partial [Pseudomonadota bacterium]
MVRLIAATVLVLATLGQPAVAQDARAVPEAASGFAPRPAVVAGREMIVAAHPLASEAGAAAMAEGGSAADAAIAALLVLGVVEPQSSGLGGGAFALVHAPGAGLTTLDARETAPAAATPALFLDGDEPLGFWEAVASGRSVGVPGLARLMGRLHADHGRLPWARLVAPAERLAREGFVVTPRLATSTATYAERLATTDAAAVLLPGGAPLVAGETLRQPALADTLARLAGEGPDALYAGPVAEAIVAATRQPPRPGVLSLEDLAAYRVIERSPVCLTYRAAWRVCGMGPPSSGATTVGQILGLMDQFPAADDPVAAAHLVAEASRLAYADRALYLADPDQVDVPVAGLMDPAYLARRAALIDPGAASTGPASAGVPAERDGRRAPQVGDTRPGTTHLSVIDGEGLALSITASIETAFGSGRVAGGMILNNQLTDFAFRPTGPDGAPVANAPGPGKRPRSSMAPTIVYAVGAPSSPRVVIGSPGGSRIPEYVAGALVAILDAGAGPAEAVAGAMVGGHVSQRNRDAVVVETGQVPEAVAEGMAAMGHAVERADMTSGLHAITVAPDG